MQILLMGLNYRTAPVEIREQFSVSEVALEQTLSDLAAMPGIAEATIVSTCNRTEVYVVTNDRVRGEQSIRLLLSRISGLSINMFKPYLYTVADQAAVLHLYHVVTGLDSMVVGETQILGQVRQAYLSAQESAVTNVVLNQLFRSAVSLGKRVQTETAIGQSAVSVSYAAVSLTKKVFDSLSHKTVLVIGAGKMSDLTLTHLAAQGVDKILVANRTVERAQEMAQKFGGIAYSMEQLREALLQADIVISSTGSKEYVLTYSLMNELMKHRKQRPLFCIDIAVPRDIDPTLGRIGNVYVYDIDDLQGVVATNVSLRKQESIRVEQMIEEEAQAFGRWQSEQAVVPLIADIRKKAMLVQESVMESLLNKLPELDERQTKVLQKHTMSIVNQMLREPISQMKEMALEPNAAESMSVFARLFGVEDVLQENDPMHHANEFSMPIREPRFDAVALNDMMIERMGSRTEKRDALPRDWNGVSGGVALSAL
ncbi:glutamyl-tRNA reductase [Sulfoacidibacillus ferrooxidans]|uniref:Glutamyl-tRNA reductase n=1 Tax=Sulfoacidibacillus ferrooxidans TaxID=2005001 RepID=A0A9X1V8K1_9BACL|nr:glutamyl-tRNA reductase [Sulfoacidibacillus ferrooxidans]MCI0183210.1 Glutamyl-tRNA reductase [Sulfoacidibacillus ferrooxidans]